MVAPTCHCDRADRVRKGAEFVACDSGVIAMVLYVRVLQDEMLWVASLQITVLYSNKVVLATCLQMAGLLLLRTVDLVQADSLWVMLLLWGHVSHVGWHVSHLT